MRPSSLRPVSILLISAFLALASSPVSWAQSGPPVLAFPGAEGFGATVTGGRGGEVYHVTTLDDSGPGSFRDAVSRPHRFVVFDVGGIIRLKSAVEVSDHVTLAGQTAPGEGISIYGQSVSLGGHQNIIIRYLRFREGISGDRGKKSLGMDRAGNIIVDHCSIEWGRWDDLGITVGSHDVTIQYCLMAEAIHPQSFGALIDSVTNVTLSHNLWMSNESRNPKAKGTIQYINNVVYNWEITGLCGGHSARDHSLDVINNYFIKGPSSNNQFAGQFLATDHVYESGNMIDMDRDGTLNGRLIKPEELHQPDEQKYTLPTFVPEPAMHPAVTVTVQSAPDAFVSVADGAGCSLRRDAIDRRLISELRSVGKLGRTIPHPDPKGEALVGGHPELKTGPAVVDTDRDGIPDEWEKAHGLNPADPADGAKLTPGGYTQLEAYVNSLVAR